MTEKQLPLYDLYDLWYEPFWHKPWFIVFTSFLAVLFIAGIIWLLICYRKKQQSLLSPWQEALNNLTHLKDASYDWPEKHKEFYQQMTAVLKKYLSRRYGLLLGSKTDDEVITILKHADIAHDLQKNVYDLMQGATLIKFANQQALREHMMLDLESAENLIKKTIPE